MIMVKMMMITVMTITSDDDDHYHHNLNHDDDQVLLTNHLSRTICFSLLTHLNLNFLTFFHLRLWLCDIVPKSLYCFRELYFYEVSTFS